MPPEEVKLTTSLGWPWKSENSRKAPLQKGAYKLLMTFSYLTSISDKKKYSMLFAYCEIVEPVTKQLYQSTVVV